MSEIMLLNIETCKLCLSVIDDEMRADAVMEECNEWMQFICEKLKIKFTDTYVLCRLCQSELRTVQIIFKRWQITQEKFRATIITNEQIVAAEQEYTIEEQPMTQKLQLQTPEITVRKTRQSQKLSAQSEVQQLNKHAKSTHTNFESTIEIIVESTEMTKKAAIDKKELLVNEQNKDLTSDSVTDDESCITEMTPIAVMYTKYGNILSHIYEDSRLERKHESTHTCFKCGNCTKIFFNVRLLRNHLKTHHLKYYKCVQCDTTFCNQNELTEHQNVMQHDMCEIHVDKGMGEIKYQCEHCVKYFRDYYGTCRHYREVHIADADRYKCSECGAKFKYKVSLENHLAKHLDMCLYKLSCELCGKQFKNNYQLGLHKRRHTGEQPYQCKSCGKLFSHRYNMIVHERTMHQKYRPFKCKHCGKEFSTSTHKRRHEMNCEQQKSEDFLSFKADKSTVNEKVYTINTDNLDVINYNANDSLLKDMDIQAKTLSHKETGDNKVHTCSQCFKTFVTRTALARHKRTHMKEFPYQCHVCKLKYTDASNYRRHKLTHENKQDIAAVNDVDNPNKNRLYLIK